MSRQLSAYPERLADIARALAAGTIPLIWMADDSTGVLRSYDALSVREEVKQEGLVRNAGGFIRFLHAISFPHGAQLNSSSVSREAVIERKTVSGFVSILHDLLLSFELPVFQKRAKRQGLQDPKFYFVDAGPFRSLRAFLTDYPEAGEWASTEVRDASTAPGSCGCRR